MRCCSWGRRRLLAALVAAVAAITVVLAIVAAPAGAIIVRLSNGKYLSYEAIGGPKAHSGPSQFDSFFSNLDYSGGPIMPSNTNYTVVWTPSNYGGTAFQSGYTTGVNQFFTDLAHDSGQSTNSDSVATQYNDSGGHTAAYSSTNGGLITVTDPLPASGCPTATICLTDDQLQAELSSVLTANHLPRDLTHQYYLLTPPDVVTCFDSAGTSCSGNVPPPQGQFCAYHSSSTASRGSFLYANIPDLAGVNGCDPFVTNCPNISCNYNNSPADGVLSAISHEHIESLTDPQPNNAWTDWQPGCGQGSPITCGGEIGDKCNNDGTSSPHLVPQDNGVGTDTPYNQVLNGHHYLIQMEWSNSSAGCLDSIGGVSPPSPTFSSSSGGGTTMNFNAGGSTGGGTLYVWQFNDDVNPADAPQENTVSTGSATISHTFPQVGSYTVALTVMKPDGTSRGTAQTVVVAAAPNAGFNASTTSAAEGQVVSFASTSSDPNPGGSIAASSWSFGDGAGASGSSVSHAFRAGFYTVTLTVINSHGLASQISRGIAVSDEGPGVSFKPPSGAAKGHAVRFSGSGSDPDGSISHYSWNFGDGSGASGQSLTHTFSRGGSFNVTLTVTDSSGHSASISHRVGVASSPPVHYKGKTKQKQSISFSVQSGKVLGLDFRIVDGCGARKTLTVHVSGFPTLSIGRNGSFGGTFGSRSQPTVVRGKVKGSSASGTLSDKSVSPRLHKLCSGSTSFTATKS